MDGIVEKVNEQAKDYVRYVNKSIPVKKALLFGSYVKGDFDGDSDVDIAVISSSFNGRDPVDINALLLSFARNFKDVCIEPIGV